VFADDCALNAGSEADLQRTVSNFSDNSSYYGLTISTNKTEVMQEPAPRKPYVELKMLINGQKINDVNRFTYLGSTLSQDATVDHEVNLRISKASSTFGIINDSVWNRRGISNQTKIK
jgi:hypothetical protein